MSDYTIQQAGLDDAPILSDLALKSKAHWGYNQIFLDNCKAELTYTAEQLNSKQWCFKVVKNLEQEVVGFYAIHYVSNQQAELNALFIEPKFIGQGIGKILLSDVIQQTKKLQLSELIIHSDPYAEDFYLSQGAIKIGETESGSIPDRFLPLLCIKL
ncbi:GNAT family N-acetyltransferase [Paraglaciecola aquimarina]|uniref:GNAT family N-acetyltransferase n=1 Tax=Paraglaciecola algarum TaxID=3050085 RepID=A0ABS9DAW2_9ALTE|nr:GNAT family N-acetyltransferase [Paraglaciecola sp. G1-23]MCF2949162.1 GNAT family N-acetyltransferase [Paraglaciecola sp. G1-23]